jgi:long-subunit acyl-CoA synthetase (AMP-forming)
MKKYPKILSEYINVIDNPSTEQFLYYYSFDQNKNIKTETLTRSEFLTLARKAAFLIKKNKIESGDKILFCFGKNNIKDIIFRFACIMTGTVPVTVNWQADPLDRIFFKLEKSNSKAIISGESFNKNYKTKIEASNPNIKHISTDELTNSSALYDYSDFEDRLTDDSTRMIVFTSGTTGDPKGQSSPRNITRIAS